MYGNIKVAEMSLSLSSATVMNFLFMRGKVSCVTAIFIHKWNVKAQSGIKQHKAVGHCLSSNEYVINRVAIGGISLATTVARIDSRS